MAKKDTTCTCNGAETRFTAIPKQYLVKGLCGKCYLPTFSVKIGYSQHQPHVQRVTRAPANILANQKRDFDRRKHAIDMIQPFHHEKGRGTVPNPAFQKHYPQQAKEYFGTKESIQAETKARKRRVFV